MAKLQKSFEDYFRIPIQLRAVGITPLRCVSQLQQALNLNQHQGLILLDERYERGSEDPYYQLLSGRSASKDLSESNSRQKIALTQKLMFKIRDFQNEWADFQILYRCKFVIGVVSLSEDFKQKDQFSQQDSKIQQKYSDYLKKTLEKLKKSLKDQNKRLAGVLFVNGNIRTLSILDCINDVVSPEQRTLIPQSVPQNELWTFLEPWLYFLIKKLQTLLCEDIFEYKSQVNESSDIIVFNKNEDKPDPKTVKKKKRGRCIKLAGDTYLMLKLYTEAYRAYSEAQEILKKVDDYLWLLGCCQGKMACLTCGCQLPQVQDSSQTFLQHMNESISLGKKIKIPAFETQNYFKIFKIFADQPKVLDQMVANYLNEHLKMHVEDQQFNIYIHIGHIYQKAGFQRKRNYYYYQAALLYLQKKPEFSQILLKEIKQSSHIKQWPEIYAKLIKLIIGTHLETFNGKLQLQLLQNCSFYLSRKDVKVTIQALNFSNFQQITIERSNQMVEILDFHAIQSSIKPKRNKLNDYFFPSENQLSTQKSKGYFMSWKKKEQRLLYQFDEEITMEGQFKNRMSFPIRMSIIIPISMGLSGSIEMHEKQIYLYSNQITKFQVQIRIRNHQHHQFKQQKSLNEMQESGQLNLSKETDGSLVNISSIFCKIWNFKFTEKLPKSILLQLYQSIPHFQILAPNQITVQSSTNLQFSFSIRKVKKQRTFDNKLGIKNRLVSQDKCELIKFDICVYYTIDVGFQENTFVGKNQDMNFTIKENQKLEQGKFSQQKLRDNSQVIYLQKFKAQRQYLKKIQICLQYAKSASSKYQISKTVVVFCRVNNSITARMLSFESEVLSSLFDSYVKFLYEGKLLIGRKEYGQQNWETQQLKKMRVYFNQHLVNQHGWQIIEDNIIVNLQLSKQSNDLLPYRVNIKTHKSNKKLELTSRPHQNVLILCQKSQKVRQNADKLQSQQSERKCKVQIQWRSMATSIQDKNGIFQYFLPLKVYKSLKKIEFKIQQITQSLKMHDKSQLIEENSNNRVFKISYKIQYESYENCEDISHQFQLFPLIIKQIRQYTIRGKHKVRSNSLCTAFENSLEVKFKTNYDEIYLLALVFSNSRQVYYHSAPIQLKSYYRLSSKSK